MHIFQSTPSVWKTTTLNAYKCWWIANFNPRLPCGRRPPHFQSVALHHSISIHAFRVEDDDEMLYGGAAGGDFNPRLPCGRRLQKLTGDLLNTHIICIYVHKAVELFYNRWHRKPLSTLLFYNFFGANGTVILCLHPIRTKTATLLQHQNRYSHRSVRLWFYSYCRDNRT